MYLSDYRARVLRRGRTEKERIEKSLELDFEQYLSHSPGRILFDYSEEEKEGVIISGTRTAAQSETKIIFYLLTRLTDKLPEGAVISYYDKAYSKKRFWLILNAEVKAFYGYFRYKIIELDYIIKYIDSNGLLHEVPCYIAGTTTFDIKEYFKMADIIQTEIPNRALNFIWAEQPDLKKGTKIIINDEVWRYTNSDKISIPGVYYSTFEKTQYNDLEDSSTDQIANQEDLNKKFFISNYPENIIDLEKQDLTFILLEKGFLIDQSLEISFAEEKEEYCIRLQGTSIIPISTGKEIIKVADKISGYSELIVVEVKDSISNFFSWLMPQKISLGKTVTLKIFSDKEYTLEDEEKNLQINQINENSFEVSGKNIGKYTIKFSDGQDIKEIPVEIVSPWM